MSAALSEEDELLAAELAFGLLDPPERQAAEARLGSDGAFADAHARWQDYMAAMFDHPGEAPSASVWSAIEARLPANDPAPALPATLRWWKAGTLVASAAAVVLGVVAIQKPQTIVERVPVVQQASAPMVAVLTGKKGFVTVSVDPASGHMTSAATGLDIGEHSPELWVIPADGRPRSMGVMNASAPGWAKLPAVASSVMTAGVTIAVSIEPVGGSPTGEPTGPVILSGKLATT
ncbi:anti-sigma factor [Sphingomonas abietis]|uniref:Anti-sigma factor n=1 Tax=Sphingomonas abietis TaxID=3012344 RepID=A0ABY7NR08_9SPHN|nr:anti-sigma factor [Sphingomonas abietis]WBO23823.1 anti-sigma factor [Sphingomonas abietis]